MYCDISKLKEKMCNCGHTPDMVAAEIGINRATFYRKLRAGGVGFTIAEAQKIVTALSLTETEAVEIFLAS